MKRITFLLIILFCFCNCTNDIGSRPFETEEEEEFSIFLPGTGTFEFTQRFQRSPKISDVSTDLRIIDGEKTNQMVNYEILVFKDSVKAFSNLDFEARGVAETNSQDSIRINTEGRILINKKNLHLSQLSTSIAISGHYTGKGELQKEVDAGFEPEEIFNVSASINDKHQLLLLSVEADASITNILGTFDGDGTFFGTVKKNDSPLGSVSADASDYAYTAEDSTLAHVLTLDVNNTTKKLILNLKKTKQ
ncbi:hypothetical protein [Flagellimonas nanhaiensis]|uniref:Uncharacterized protein n=1 Tax=Flagellimonas nanhaiensis TaxID=2292706 RepID=A0A371JR90_9FLAO|nr:hypothetical protein [Allomuricauda nanhaiensis]RDY60019.1 hypothetical protein DX873_11785 [Allomuricauda nanhaiensis]